MRITNTLRRWFLLHFIVDIIIAIPLFIAPTWTLSLFQLETIDPITARLVAAALFAIGGTSLVMHQEGKAVFKTMLNLKLIWSSFAILALGIALLQGAPWTVWIFFIIFVLFNILWIHYWKKLQ